MNKQHKNKFRAVGLMGLLVLSLVMFPSASLAVEEEVGECELAMGRCVQEAMFLGYHTDTIINCLIGYAFCKKYIESV